MRIIAPTTWKSSCPELDLPTILQLIDNDFQPTLSSQHSLSDYAHKLQEKAHIFLAEERGELMGLLAAYINENFDTYISFIDVLPSWRKQGIAYTLLRSLQREAQRKNSRGITCRVTADNIAARNMYLKSNFIEIGNNFHINGTKKILVRWYNKNYK